MLPTNQNVMKSLNVRFKGAVMANPIGSNADGWAVFFHAPDGRSWAFDKNVQLCASKPNTKKAEFWAQCLEFIKEIPELEPLPIVYEIPQEKIDNTPGDTKLDIRDPRFRFPTGAELDDAIEFLGLGYNDFCAMFGIEYRTLLRWRQGRTSIHYSLWRLILIHSGKIEI